MFVLCNCYKQGVTIIFPSLFLKNAQLQFAAVSSHKHCELISDWHHMEQVTSPYPVKALGLKNDCFLSMLVSILDQQLPPYLKQKK